MQPRPMAETSKLLFPSLRFCIVSPSSPHWSRQSSYLLLQASDSPARQGRYQNLGSLDVGNLFEVALTDFLFTDLKFLDFSAHRTRFWSVCLSGKGVCVKEALLFCRGPPPRVATGELPGIVPFLPPVLRVELST